MYVGWGLGRLVCIYMQVCIACGVHPDRSTDRPIDGPTNRHSSCVQDEGSPIEASLAAFQRQFPTRADHFRLGCGLCILLQDQLLTRAQVGGRVE